MTDLNEFLQPINAPVTQDRGFTLGYNFDLNYDRNIITTSKVQSISADRIASGTVVVAVNLGTASGGAYLLLDGANNRILVNDGTTNRVVIGEV